MFREFEDNLLVNLYNAPPLHTLRKEHLNLDDDHLFHQYQEIEQSPLILTELSLNTKQTTAFYVWIETGTQMSWDYFKHILLFYTKLLDRTQVSQLRNVFSKEALGLNRLMGPDPSLMINGSPTAIHI